MTDDEVLYSVDDGVATITLNRPEKLNAVTGSMIARLIELFDETDRDDSVRAVIVTGAGRAFCAGADLSAEGGTFDYSDRPEAQESAPPDAGGEFTLRVYRSLKPVIAAVNGSAVGFGASMILPMDIRIVADTAKIGYVFAARGIVPDAASSWFLPRVVGLPNALEWCLSARLLRAQEAKEGGLFSRIAPAESVLDIARGIAQEIATNVAPVSAALTRQMLWQFASAPHPMDAHRIDSAGIFYTGQAADASEGVRAFLERRTPSWTMQPSTDLPPWYPWSEEPRYMP